MTAQFETVEPASATRAKLRGHIEFATSPGAFYTMHDFEGEVRLDSRNIVFTETKGDPDERFTFGGHISENGRLIALTATWGADNRSDPFYLVHEDVVERYIQEHDET